ncbi:flagellar hook capping FlgD N-terminal domain-containing protein [Maliponia aquimaris]|uniref:Basal-body rod modification protein FlgD n=1 Tax=Maliponia aquimaris TaxID=1673631 RepID=A0A238JQR8_9RHOB|nr:flagellar hook capping FlgD N-terminal domain-containing protein [Maliponia aquimaris]SMX32192.1 Basal-body rod modification protein FlgD [Maliponia aquimaris]
MADIASPPPLYGNTPTASVASRLTAEEAKDSKAVLSSDFDTFLKMLTVQVQNQDPLNPVDSTDYATQLATFSSVEQQVLTNDLLREVNASLSGSMLQELSSWIGMEALVRAPAHFSGSPVAIRPDYATGADAATLLVRDAQGVVVQSFDLAPGQEEVLWAGVDDTGELMPTGSYRFEVQSYKNEALIDTRQAQTYSRIEEVRKDGSGVVLRLAGGATADPELIDGLRAPQF